MKNVISLVFLRRIYQNIFLENTHVMAESFNAKNVISASTALVIFPLTKKTCKGRYLSRTVLEEKASKVHDLEQEIASLNSKIFVDDLENEAADDDIQEVNNDIEMPSPLLKTPKLSLETIEDTDIKNNQVYFFECGPLLKPFVDTEAVLIKFGSTDQPYTRLSTHKRDFGGGRLIDSILTNNPKSVESDLKKWLRITGKTVKCKTDKKSSIETEIIGVTSQASYACIISKAKQFAEDYKRDVEKTIGIQRSVDRGHK